MDSLVPILLVLFALLAGLIVGWVARGRAAEPVRIERDRLRAEGEALRERFNAAIVDLSAASVRAEAADGLAAEADVLREARDGALREVTRLSTEAETREEAFAQRLTELREAKEALSHQFGEIGGKLLEAAQRQFLERADQRFKESEERAGLGIKALLQPVDDRLRAYEEGVAKVEKERQEAYGNLTGLIDGLRAGQEAVRSEAAKLANSLRSAPKARGRWGEQQLRNVLETCGLSDHADFRTEVSVDGGEDGRLRPDVIVRVPGGRALVIDAKVSLNAYQDAFHATEERERAAGLAAHATAMKAHVNTLGNKAYWAQFDDAPDYVIMFVPGEHFLAAALEHDPTLWDFAFDKRVLLATPTNLIAIARTVAAVWRQEKLAAEARQIGELGKEMYDRLATAAGHMRMMGGGLTSAVNHYNKFVGSFEKNILSTGRKFRDLNIETGNKEIEQVAPVEALARHGEDTLLEAPVDSAD